ncbi:roadblock/LC7 domain-containing protein [Saccharopolyspora sp. K220]|uniref:roadblock/LC7 domain-containing protein n=1 Tax=Saccharopolyspora soli TaxID=2926618 RepID=UPI001F597CEE|nr:roadblock/LC7 domain-containing protein [Saccharopolyspora soli]MCI2422903.1 roadblock/LC7 domain-containing protein [Saccharopolyspora soli]
MTTPMSDNNLGWMLDQFLLGVPGTRHSGVPGVQRAVLFSTDGMLMAWTSNLDRDTADPVAGALSGLQSLASSETLATFCGGKTIPWAHNVNVYGDADAFLVLAAASARSCLGVATGRSVDLEEVTAAIGTLTKKLGEHLAIPQRGFTWLGSHVHLDGQIEPGSGQGEPGGAAPSVLPQRGRTT